MAARHRSAPEHWYGEAPVPFVAALLERPFRLLAGMRRGAYRVGLLRARSAPVPVVVVGNITAGGTGKTPLVLALVERLQDAGWNPGIASRGHGRRDPAGARWVEADTDPELGGDEPVLLARLGAVPVRVDRDRVAAARALAAAGCDVVVCDDGLQHYRLARDVEIEVIDGHRRYGNRRLLPAGPLREPPQRSMACDFRVVNLGDAGPEGQDAGAGFGEWAMRLVPGAARPLLGGRPRPLSAFTGQRVHAVAGIGNPGRFFTMLRRAGIAVVPHAFPDHHHYEAEDFAFGSDLPVLMTEKDAVKCAALATARFHAVPVRAELPEAFWIALLERLHGAA